MLKTTLMISHRFMGSQESFKRTSLNMYVLREDRPWVCLLYQA